MKITFTPEPCCQNCHYAKPGRGADGKIDFNMKVCKRWPPTFVYQPMANPAGQIFMQASGVGFPNVNRDEWCGEWREKTPMQTALEAEQKSLAHN